MKSDPRERPPRRWHLMNGEELARAHPETFQMEPRAYRLSLKPGYFAKVGFEFDDASEEENGGERMWVIVTRVNSAGGHVRYSATLDNDPLILTKELVAGQTVEFGPEHILNWMTPAEMEAAAAASKAQRRASSR